jgi:hypothetical protein
MVQRPARPASLGFGVNTDQLAAVYRTLALDGCDGTGKTTMANRLVTRHGFTVVHSARTPDGTDLTARYQRILAAPGRLVLDRCFVSELVYGPLHHNRSRITLDEAVGLAEAVAARDGALIHLTGLPAAIHSRLLAREGSNAPGMSEVEALVTAYDRVFAAIAARLPGRVRCLHTTGEEGRPG